ncbi:MAG TPA: hypothetical protein V6D03_09825, partial [Candidatus Caenarcaniphilales bacterium]
MTETKPRALITGATTSISRATIVALAQVGIGVALVSRSPSKVAATANSNYSAMLSPVSVAQSILQTALLAKLWLK